MLPLALLFASHLIPDTPQTPWKQPQLANRNQVLMLTFGSGNSIYYAASGDHGKTFSKPVKVAEKGFLALGRHRGPRVESYAGNIIITAIAGEKGRGADGDLFAWRSDDEGQTWKTPVRINDVEGSAREGLHAMSASNGWVVAAWLDLRDKGTRIYSSVSRDGGETWGQNSLVYASPDGTVCQCCHPSVTIGHGGAIYVMFRNALGGSRDMYLAVSRDAGKTYQTEKLGRGTWLLNACPMDGGGLAVASNGSLLSIWRRESTVMSAKQGEKEAELGPGKDPSIAAGLNNSLYAVWVSGTEIKFRSSLKPEAVTLSPKGEYPQVILSSNGKPVAAWEQDGGIVVQPVE
ncbi:MAG: exo-alpha-sialidase [Acidobacteriia bacterium]|nr:exo-alpha-sialidase [Terriglobia bacterium]